MLLGQNFTQNHNMIHPGVKTTGILKACLAIEKMDSLNESEKEKRVSSIRFRSPSSKKERRDSRRGSRRKSKSKKRRRSSSKSNNKVFDFETPRKKDSEHPESGEDTSILRNE